MGWYTEVIFLLLIRYTTTSEIFHNTDLTQSLGDEDLQQGINLDKEGMMSFVEQYEDVRLAELGTILANVLLRPWPKGISPIVYVENTPSANTENKAPADIDTEEAEETNVPFKRSRYYRKYPWKRQNSRYDAENRYLCQPSKDDVFRLLVALHEARQGNRGQVINFCNRRRPASAIFTNIRFLG